MKASNSKKRKIAAVVADLGERTREITANIAELKRSVFAAKCSEANKAEAYLLIDQMEKIIAA